MLDQEFRQFIESVKLRAPIEEVVRERVPDLKRQGALWVACCPFHQERTPSFKVDPRRGTWHCFGACSTGGDAIRFVERYENVSFREALETLALHVGLEPPAKRRAGPGERELEPLYELVEQAATTFARHLRSPEGEPARRYLHERGLEEATWDAFGLGWAPAGRGGALTARADGALVARLERVGLARRRDDGSAYDFFRGRLMVPIRDRRGRVVGFGGRVLPGDEERGPKYVNTGETPLFQKGRLIFGYDRALDAVRRTRHLVLVEGYTDVMAAHQAGASNVVAVLGTATTEEHAGLVRRSGARRVTLLFDGDEAGRRATSRALWGLLPLDLEIDVAPLPAGTDPCDLCVSGGAGALEGLLARPRDWFEFVLEPLAALAPAEQARAADEVFELLARLSRPMHRDGLLARMASYLGLSEVGVREQYEELSRRRRPGRARDALEPRNGRAAAATEEPAAPVPAAPPASRRAVLDLFGACLVDNSLVPLAQPVLEACRDDAAYPPALRQLVGALLTLHADDGDLRPIDASRLLDVLPEGAARDHVVGIEERARCAEDPAQLVADGLRHFERLERAENIRRSVRALSGNVDDPQQQSILRDLYRRMSVS